MTWLQPYPDALLQQVPELSRDPEARYQALEAVELAFIIALQQLPPRQAAALLLHDVVGFGSQEVADMLGTRPTVVKGLLQRARASVDRRRGLAAEERHSTAGRTEDRDLAQRFATAFVEGDVDTVVALMTDDAWLSMPPASHEYHGPAEIARFLDASVGWRRQQRGGLVPTRANGQLAFGYYVLHPGEPRARAASLLVMTIRADRIASLIHFVDPDLRRYFGLPDTLE